MTRVFFSLDPTTDKTSSDNNGKLMQLGVHASCEFFFCTDIREISAHWTKLQSDAHYFPFQEFAWVNSVLEAVENQKSRKNSNLERPLFVIGFEGSEPVAILPFCICKGFWGTHLTWFADTISDYNGMVIDKRFANTISEDLLGRVISMLRAAFPKIQAAHLIRNPLGDFGFKHEHRTKSSVQAAEFSSHSLNLTQDWKALYAGRRSSKSRQRLRSKYRALSKTGDICFKQVRGTLAKLDAIEQILRWKSEQLKSNGRRSPFGTIKAPSTLRLAIEFIARNSQQNEFRVFGLYRDGQLIAGMIAFLSGGRFYYFISSYSPQVGGNYSVGTQVLVKTLEFAARAGFEQYDFLIGDEDYKPVWCDTVIPLVDLAIPFTARGRVFCAIANTRLRVKKAIMANIWLYDLLHLVRSTANRLSDLSKDSGDQIIAPLTQNNRENGKPAGQKKELA